MDWDTIEYFNLILFYFKKVFLCFYVFMFFILVFYSFLWTIKVLFLRALDKDLMETGGWSLDQLMELAGLSVAQAGKLHRS